MEKEEQVLSTVKVFITNVPSKLYALSIIALLKDEKPYHRITFDLDDVDKVLRVEGDNVESERVINILNTLGFTCMEMI